MKSIITKPILEFQSFLDYKEDILRFKLDRWLLDTRIKELNNYDFSFIDLNSVLLGDDLEDVSIVSPKNKAITSSENFFYTANVLSNHSPQLSSSLFVDIGSGEFSENYLNKNIIAVDVYGNLVGRVVKESVSSNGALVQLINDINSRVIVSKKNIPNSTALLLPLSSDRFELLGNNNYNILKGDTLYTSYKSDIYLKDIPVCRVISIDNRNDNNSFKKIMVELLADFKNLEYVFIVESDLENNRVKY